MKKLKKIVWEILRRLHLGGIVQLSYESVLTRNGWYRSYYTKQAVDSLGRPLPWCTYPYIRFIGPRLHKGMHVFEYGCGNSTLWFADRVASVTSVEHDQAWAAHLSRTAPANARIIYQELAYNGQYAQTAPAQNRKFDIIVVDGRDRVNSAKQATQALTERGVIVFDNSDRDDYANGLKFLEQQGFRRIDFWGLSPVTAHENVTTIFYRDGNCLGL